MHAPEIKNGTIEDLGPLIGYSATVRLTALYGGSVMHIPVAAYGDHPIARLIGVNAMRALCAEYGGDKLRITNHVEYDRLLKVRRVAELIKNGMSYAGIEQITATPPRSIQRYRRLAEHYGILPVIFGGESGEGQRAEDRGVV